MTRFKFLPFLALLLAPCSQGAVAFVQSLDSGGFNQTTAATSATFTLSTTTTSGHDIIAVVSQLSTTGHVTFICGGTSCTQSSFTGFFAPYSGGPTTTGSGNQVWICHKCVAISVITVHVSASTVFSVAVNEYSGVSSITQVSSTTGTSTTPSIAMNIVNANDFIVGAFSSRGSSGVPTAGTGNLRSAARNGTTTSFTGVGEVDNTSGSAGTSVTTSETITSTNDTWTAIGIELSATTQATPTDFVSANTSEDPGGNEASAYSTTQTFPMVPDPVLSGNTVICAVGYTHASTTLTLNTLNTIGGSNIDSFTSDLTEDDASGTTLQVFRVAATAGTQYVKLNWTTQPAASTKLVVSCSEHYNITTSSPKDVTCGGTAQALPVVSCGSMTPTVSNDLIYVVGMMDGQNSYGQGYYYTSPGYQFATIISNGTVGTYAESFVDPNTSAITPTMYLGVAPGGAILPANVANIAGVAYKTTSTGTAPTGMYIARQAIFNQVGAGFVYQACPSTGNFNSYAFTNGDGATQGFKVWDSNQVAYTWNQPSSATPVPLLDSSSNSTLDPTSACLFDHISTGNDEAVQRDVYGVATSTVFDTPTCPASSPVGNVSGNTQGATACWNSQTQSAGSLPHMPILTPSVSTKTLTILALYNGAGPITGAASNVSGVITDCPVFSGQTDADPLCEGQGHAHYYSTSTSNQDYTWAVSNVASAGQGVGWDINAAPVAVASTEPTLLLLGVGP